jgi:hypothetical protein
MLCKLNSFPVSLVHIFNPQSDQNTRFSVVPYTSTSDIDDMLSAVFSCPEKAEKCTVACFGFI